MIIHEAKPKQRATREMKVNLPVELHIRLHEAKILDGKRICDVVTRALDVYLQAQRERALEDE